jgi:hypothetical protein
MSGAEFSVTYRFVFVEVLNSEYALQAWRIHPKHVDCRGCGFEPTLIETLQHPKHVEVAPPAPMFWYCWELHARYGVPEELTRDTWEAFMKEMAAR